MYVITYMWYLKNMYKWTYLQNRNRLTDIERKFRITKVESGVVGRRGVGGEIMCLRLTDTHYYM